MLDHRQFKTRLVMELRRHRILEMVDDGPIANCVLELVKLERQCSQGCSTICA
jgi:hypothetical protein